MNKILTVWSFAQVVHAHPGSGLRCGHLLPRARSAAAGTRSPRPSWQRRAWAAVAATSAGPPIPMWS